MAPKCTVCGKELKNPNSATHIKSQYHQKALQGSAAPKSQTKSFPQSTSIGSNKRIDSLERRISDLEKLVGKLIREVKTLRGKKPQVAKVKKLSQKEFDGIITNIYHDLRIRRNQPIQLSRIWQKFQQKSSIAKDQFCDLLLSSKSRAFHLQQGKGGLQIYDPMSGRSYGLIIGR